MDIDVLKLRAKAFDFLYDAVVVTDIEGIIIDWNAGSEQLYGYSKEQAIGQPVNMLHVPEDSANITAEVIATVEERGKWTGEIRMLHKDGYIGWVESMCVPIFDEQHNMLGALGINRDITKRKNEVERLDHLAHYDQLTNVPNRNLLLDRLSHLISQSTRSNARFALLFIDIDKFKEINDTKGHIFGDEVLKEVASRLNQAIRKSDTVARFGGDEFIILLENISDNNDALNLVQHLNRSLNKPFNINNEELTVSYSIGQAIFPDDAITSDGLISVADQSMYRTKELSHQF